MSKNGQCCYYIYAYLYIFIMQGALSFIVSAPVLYVTANSSMLQGVGGSYPLVWTDYTGIVIFVIGLLFEWVGDEQLKTHIAN